MSDQLVRGLLILDLLTLNGRLDAVFSVVILFVCVIPDCKLISNNEIKRVNRYIGKITWLVNGVSISLTIVSKVNEIGVFRLGNVVFVIVF